MPMIKRVLKLFKREALPGEAEKAPTVGHGDELPIPEGWKGLLSELERSEGHFFVTGQAGSGKSSFIDLFRRLTGKNVVLLAPTPLAAITAGGVTIHSFARLPSTVITEDSARETTDRELVRAIDTIVVDEASQVRCDLLDGLDRFMRRNGRDDKLPFGGAQVILVGDPYQLSPVVTDGEREMLKRAGYPGPFYFWNSKVYPEINPGKIVLTTVHRGGEQELLHVLDCIRGNDVDSGKLDLLQRCMAEPAFDPFSTPFHTMLTPDDGEAGYYNNRELYRLPGAQREYRARREGSALNIDSPDRNFPCEENLLLRVGARVVCCKNVNAALQNGTTGTVTDLEEAAVLMRTDAGESVRVLPAVWELIKYSCSRETGRIEATVTGTIQQIPLRHAWALAIHRAQGMILDRAYIDLSNEAFHRGPGYLALSRCRTLAGLKLKGPFFEPEDLMVDEGVVAFMSSFRGNGGDVRFRTVGGGGVRR